jgi:hypothetical protein
VRLPEPARRLSAFYLLMYGTDRPGRRPPAADEASDLLLKFPDRVAAAGRLRVPSALAARLCLAAVTAADGATLPIRPPETAPPRLAPPARPLTRTVAKQVAG